MPGGHLLRHLARAPGPACARLFTRLRLQQAGPVIRGGDQPSPDQGTPGPPPRWTPNRETAIPSPLEHRFPAKSGITGRGNGHWGFPGLTKPAAPGFGGPQGQCRLRPLSGRPKFNSNPPAAGPAQHRCPGRGFMGTVTAAPARRTLPCRVQRAARPDLQAKQRARGPGARGPDRLDAQHGAAAAADFN